MLFYCSGNSARSQMGEGLARKYFGERMQIFSAGAKAQGLNPYAVQAMQILDVDISEQPSTKVQDLALMRFDYVLTLCEAAPATRPFFHGAKLIHYALKDPQVMARQLKDEAEKLRCFVQTACEIENFIKALPVLYPDVFGEN